MKSSHLAMLTFAASMLALAAAPSLAQNYDRGGYDDEIVVTAPYQHHTPDRDPSTGARIDTVAASRFVEIANLDLRYNRDVAELRRRVHDSAVNACEEVEASTAPNEQITTRTECGRHAELDAMAEANDRIAYARG